VTIHKTLIPRTVGVAAAAALFAGLASSGVAKAPTASTPASEAASEQGSASTVTRIRYTDVIALRPDPANPSLLVVDFGKDGFGR
jgi:deoxyinosine 3'endonuclease (endonuclease V)